MALIEEMQRFYGPRSSFRVGIGTLCRRASTQLIHEVVLAVSQVLPGVPLHLWGVKVGALQAPLALPDQVVSVDSAAWNGLFRRGRTAWKQSGLSQRQYTLTVALPRYRARIEEALAVPKQMLLL